MLSESLLTADMLTLITALEGRSVASADDLVQSTFHKLNRSVELSAHTSGMWTSGLDYMLHTGTKVPDILGISGR